MALGGGMFTTQNKTLPGTYINFSSVAKASAALSDRGLAAMPFMLDWGPENQVFTVTGEDLQKNSLQLFGYSYTDTALLPLREIFRNAKTLYAYRLNSNGIKAANSFCEAKYSGLVGNKLSTVIGANVDNEGLFDVATYYDGALLDTQTVATAADLSDNDFVVWKKNATLEETASTPLTDGTNGEMQALAYQTFLDKIESYSFNALGCPSDDATVIGLFASFTKRMRDEVGAKFQTVVYSPIEKEKAADYEGVIEVGNTCKGEGLGKYGLIYWVTGAAAGCEVNLSNTNKPYDGECEPNADYTQADLEKALKAGRFMLHNVNGEFRVLEDINSLVTLSDSKGEVFQSNQTVRVCDQIANDVAHLFHTRYLGIVPNDASGRITLWNDICKLHQDLEKIRAIENFNPESVRVTQGDRKKAVVCNIKGLNIVNAMAQLYMSVIIE